MNALPLLAAGATVWAALFKALATAAQPHRATCARCGRRVERHRLGDPVCRCS